MALSNDIQERYKELLSSYLNLKPVLTNLFIRNGYAYPDGLLNEIRAINDHLARCFREEVTEKMAWEQLYKADGHLKRLIFDSFKQLNIIYFEYTKNYEDRYFGSHWIMLENGRFWREYSAKRRKIIEIIESGKNMESVDTVDSINEYQKAYIEEEIVYNLLRKNKSALQLSRWRKILNVVDSNVGWFLSTLLLAVVPAIIWELIMHWSSILDWISSIW